MITENTINKITKLYTDGYKNGINDAFELLRMIYQRNKSLQELKDFVFNKANYSIEEWKIIEEISSINNNKESDE